jgi:hypothetical protein
MTSEEKPQAEWFGGYQGGMLRWNTLKKKGRYTRSSKMMQRILSTTISK